MKKRVSFLVAMLLSFAIMLSACGGNEKCHNCGKEINGDPVEGGGRYYCSYDCYMDEALFG